MNQEVNPRVAMVDFAPFKPSPRMIQTIPIDYDAALANLIGDRFISRAKIEDEFGHDWYQAFRAHPEAVMMYSIFDHLKNHAVMVARTMQTVWHDLDMSSERPYLIPSRSVSGVPDFQLDHREGPTVVIPIEPENVIAALIGARKEFPTLNVLNLSLLMGKLPYRFEIDSEVLAGTKSPEPQILGTYGRGEVLENLPKLFPICEEFPDMVVSAAAGNWKDDLRPAREVHRQTWPVNLNMLAAWDSEMLNNEVYGADVYIGNYAEGKSSFATAVSSALARFFRNDLGLTSDETVAQIRRLGRSTGGYNVIEDPKKLFFQARLAREEAALSTSPRRAS